jgi:hypothetical protein
MRERHKATAPGTSTYLFDWSGSTYSASLVPKMFMGDERKRNRVLQFLRSSLYAAYQWRGRMIFVSLANYTSAIAL